MMLGIQGARIRRTASRSSRSTATACRRSRSASSSTRTSRWSGAARWYPGARAVPQRHRVARPRLPGRRPAAGHRRRPAVAGADDPDHRRGHRHHAAGHRAGRRAQGPRHVPEGRYADPRRGGEHVGPSCASAATRATSSAPAARERMAKDTAPNSWASCRSTRRTAARPITASRRWSRSPTARSPRFTAGSRGAARSRSPSCSAT